MTTDTVLGIMGQTGLATGVQICTVNVYGLSRGVQMGQIVVGNAWDNRTTWASINFEYSIN